MIKIPGITSDVIYAIVIQVKDYQDVVSNDVITQINKADIYWSLKDFKVIDKIMLITKAEKEENLELSNNSDDVRITFADDLKELIFNYITREFLN